MIAAFDGTDEHRQVTEATELRYRHGMSYRAVPVALQVGNEWQVWWRDTDRQSWYYRASNTEVVQIPFDVIR